MYIYIYIYIHVYIYTYIFYIYVYKEIYLFWKQPYSWWNGNHVFSKLSIYLQKSHIHRKKRPGYPQKSLIHSEKCPNTNDALQAYDRSLLQHMDTGAVSFSECICRCICNTLQLTATYCTLLQHTAAPRCNFLFWVNLQFHSQHIQTHFSTQHTDAVSFFEFVC